MGLLFPNGGQPESSHTVNQKGKSRSPRMLSRTRSRTILLRQYQCLLRSTEVTSDSGKRGDLQSLGSFKKGTVPHGAYKETKV